MRKMILLSGYKKQNFGFVGVLEEDACNLQSTIGKLKMMNWES